MAVYFHENQFNYPGQVRDPAGFQFSSINFTSALCADSLAFNSTHNLESFLAGICSYLKKATDMDLRHLEKKIRRKSVVLYPGMDFRDIDAAVAEKNTGLSVPVIIWNHRWEHDKDPETFFAALFDLVNVCDFRLIVLGEHFRDHPEVFDRAGKVLADKILYFDFAESRRKYARLLTCGTIIVSTALHEFFGMSVLEGVRAGCRPLVPDRLSYQELFPAQYRYPEQSFKKYLQQAVQDSLDFSVAEGKQLTESFSWPVMAPSYRNWLCALSSITPA